MPWTGRSSWLRCWASRFKPDSADDEPDAHEYVTGTGFDDKWADYEAMARILGSAT